MAGIERHSRAAQRRVPAVRHVSARLGAATWRTHSCVPCSHSCEHVFVWASEGVHTSVNAERTSACATSKLALREWPSTIPGVLTRPPPAFRAEENAPRLG